MKLNAPTSSRNAVSRTTKQHPLCRLSGRCPSKKVLQNLPPCDRRLVLQSVRGAYAAAPTAEVYTSETVVASYGALHPGPPSAADVVLRFIDALNARDLSSLLMMVADDCLHEDLSHETKAQSKEEVARFYADVVSSMPEKVRVVVDDVTGGDPVKVGLTWHMEVDGVEVPCSRGLSFYRVRPTDWAGGAGSCVGGGCGGLITYVRQSPEHFIKLSGVVLSATASATPLIDSLGPMVLPSFWSNLARGASNMLASAPPVDEMLRNLAAAGATNTVPSMTDIMGMAAAAAAANGSGGAGGAGHAGAHLRTGGGFSGGSGVSGRAFSSMAMPAAPASAAMGGAVPRSVYMQPAFQGPSALAAGSGAAAAAYPHTHLSAPRAVAAAAQATAGTAQPPATDAGAAPARASPVVFAASVSVAERPSTDTATAGVGHGSIFSDASASFASVGSMYGSVGSVDFDLAQMTAYGGAPGAGFAAPVAAADGAVAAATATAASVSAPCGVAVAAPEQALRQTPAEPLLRDETTTALATPPVPSVPMSSLAGIWEKDLEASDVAGYEKALDLWQISGVQKATARLIEGLELAVGGGGGSGGAFNVHFLTIIPYFKVTETYPLGGRRAKLRRRDQRSGDAAAHAEALPNGVVCRASWAAPFAGELEESYTLPDPAGQPDLMHVTSTIRVGGKEATTLQVYHRRRNMSARDLISASEKRNGKANDVLKRFGM